MNALPCIACGRELPQVDREADVNQPYGGTAFVSHGHYGSTAYDPMDGHYLEINVCDLCLVSHPERALEARDRRPVMEGGAVVGWADTTERAVPWMPDRRTFDHVVGVAVEEFVGLAPDAEELRASGPPGGQPKEGGNT